MFIVDSFLKDRERLTTRMEDKEFGDLWVDW
jgi:hypothetical protein